MIFDLTPDQEFLRETTAKFLTSQVPVGELRRLRDDAAGFESEYWRRGCDLGWTSLLVSEERGGGSVSGRGLIDLTLIAHEFGRHAAPGPLLSNSVIAGALSEHSAHSDVLDGLLSGRATAAWCLEEPGRQPFGQVSLQARVEGGEVVLDGQKRPVESAMQADHLLVTARDGDGLTQVLVGRDTPGVSLKAMQSVDLTRRFAVVDFDGARVPLDALVGEAGQAGPQVAKQLRQGLVVQIAETVGAMSKAFDMTVEWAFDRYSFGRPLASYQELKHRFADMKSWLEAGHAIADAAANAVDANSEQADQLVSAAKAFVGHYGSELLQDCVQMHGGIGVTYEHDLHLFLRRVTINRSLLGTPADHRRRLAAIALQEDAA